MLTETRDPLVEVWKSFIETHKIPETLDLRIVASWERCWSRLNPYQRPRFNRLTSDNLLATQISNLDLVSIAQPIMEDIYQYIEGSSSAIGLANSTGYLINLIGDQDMLHRLETIGITTGTLLSEEHVGTNAIHLSMLERIPMRVKGAEHFLKAFHTLSEASAPIFDITGKPLGSISVINRAFHQGPHSLGLVVAGARAIEGQLKSNLLLEEQNKQLGELNAILGAINDGILLWNESNVLMHINAAAAKILGQPARVLLGRQIKGIIEFPAFVEEAILEKLPLTNVEASIKLGDNLISCILTLRFIKTKRDEQPSTLITIRQDKEVRQLVQQQSGFLATSSFADIVSDSMEMHHIIRTAHIAASARACVLIRGESGTGKKVLASSIHNAGPRKDGPFVVFACSTIPNELIVSELLGYEENNPHKHPNGRPGKFELANGGTIFFQDVHALPLEAQSVLLNVIDLGFVQRLGGDHPIHLDVRIIAATSENLEHLVSKGRFRADLYYRLRGFDINVPPLRERKRDLPILVERILDRYSRNLDRTLHLAPGVIELLKKYPWPGNIPELEAILELAAIQTGPSGEIESVHLPEAIRQPFLINMADAGQGVPSSLLDLEREALLQTARLCKGNMSKMAKILGISRSTVWRKLKRFRIPVDQYRLD
jgi:transcriptional regulator of acetoin/glycerol metabolism